MNAPATELELGVLRHLRGDLEGAEELYRAALAAEPADPVTLNNLGFVIAQSGRFTEAVTWYEWALELDADRAVAHLNLGNARAELGDLDGGIEELRRSAELAPGDPTPRTAWAAVVAARGRLEEAVEILQQALTLDDEYAPAWAQLGALLLVRGAPISPFSNALGALLANGSS